MSPFDSCRLLTACAVTTLASASFAWPAAAQMQPGTTVHVRNKLNAPLLFRSSATGGAAWHRPPAQRISAGGSTTFSLLSPPGAGLVGSVTYETDGLPRGCRLRFVIAPLPNGKWQFNNEASAVPRSASICQVSVDQADPRAGRQSITLTIR